MDSRDGKDRYMRRGIDDVIAGYHAKGRVFIATLPIFWLFEGTPQRKDYHGSILSRNQRF